MPDNSATILVINSGSSSLKFGLYTNEGGKEALQFTGSLDAIGTGGGKLKLKDGEGRSLVGRSSHVTSQEDAFTTAMKLLQDAGAPDPAAIGHRIVHGGPKLRQHQRITPDVLETLKQAVHFAPLHDPPAIAIIEAVQKQYSTVPQFACFDTAFHITIPEVAAHYPLPTQYWEQGVLRYGFHGLSYESIVHTLGVNIPQRMVVAHLGNGASLAAILDGQSVDTSMGLTPTGGIPMGTRSGDLDPGVVLWLLRNGNTVDGVESLLNHQSGLAGLANGDSDMRALTTVADQGNKPALLAIDVFTRSIAKTIASYMVSLGGLDTLVFTGGIGENSIPVRRKVCAHLAPMNIFLDDAKNQLSAETISGDHSGVTVRVIETDEDGTIARHTRALLTSG